jgi:hypothetical protein
MWQSSQPSPYTCVPTNTLVAKKEATKEATKRLLGNTKYLYIYPIYLGYQFSRATATYPNSPNRGRLVAGLVAGKGEWLWRNAAF